MRSFTCLALVFLVASAGSAQTVPSGFEATPYSLPALTPATGLAWAPDGSGRLFLLHKNGTVRVAAMSAGELATSGGMLVTSTFATESVHTNSECGLLGMAFDPDYAVNRYVYFFVTANASTQRIVRYTDANGVGTGRAVVVDSLPTVGQNHDGGALGIGSDGKLYWAIGDLGNGSGADADLTSLAAKIGRANLDGTPVDDNPFFDGAGPNNDYIWARGFRNPFTFTFQPGTWRLWVNTVGASWEQVFVPSAGDHAGYDDYENNQPAGYLEPTIAYRTNSAVSRTITASGATRSGGVVTLTTASSHAFRRGARITIAGVTDASFNGNVFVASTPSTTTFTAVQAGPDSTSGGGTATSDALGGAITGGVFYDATLFPTDYRGNYFFGDFNASRIVRSTFAGDGGIATVDSWGTGFSQSVDMDVGPDGALYVIGVTSGAVVRVRPTAPGPKLVVSPLHRLVTEGGRSVFTVRLAEPPAQDVAVTVQRATGDADLAVATGANLVFTAANWSEPQAVKIASSEDVDADPDLATFSVAASGFATEHVEVRSIDDNAPRVLVSTATTMVDEGADATFTVTLSKAPAGPVTVSVVRTAGDSDVSVADGAALVFGPSDFDMPQTVTVAAAHDEDNQPDVATLTLAAPGVVARSVTVLVRDDEPGAPVIASTPETTAVVGAEYRYEVIAAGTPAPTFSLTSSAPGPVIDATTGVLTWTPTEVGTIDVTVRAANGVLPDAEQSFQITAQADAPPSAVLTRPLASEQVEGTMAELFGDCVDDVGCTHAEFFVDGVLGFTDTQTSGHYHFGGSHNLWDTSALTPGAHVVRFVVHDTAGQTGTTEVTVCVGGPCPIAGDAGTDASGDVDAGTDGGTGPSPTSAGCGCNTSGSDTGFLPLAVLLFLRRRRRP